MFCTKCGTSVADGTKFCPSCGNALAQPAQQPNYQQTYQQPTSQPEYQQAGKNHWLIVMDLEIEA